MLTPVQSARPAQELEHAVPAGPPDRWGRRASARDWLPSARKAGAYAGEGGAHCVRDGI